MRMICLVLLFSLIGWTCNNNLNQSGETEIPVKNIILLIGDGMGLAQVSTAYYFGEQEPNFSRFKYIGLHKNAPTDKKITDSAAGATAFSTGYKSYNAAIGVDADTIARETILEWAEKQGKSTGLIATSTITHATPACFYAHVDDRNKHEEIAEDLAESEVDFVAGGGFQYFNQRSDGKDLIEVMRQKGMEIHMDKLRSNLRFGRRYAFLLEPDSLHSIRGGRGDFLENATRTGLDYLSRDEDGFFLMIEGSQIDWAGHDNDADYLIGELLDFDKAIGLALDFAEKNGNTLVVVTADHETGGLSLSAAEVFGMREYGAIRPTFSTGGHSASLIPVFAFGPGAESFTGIYQNNEIFDKMMKAFGQ